MSVLKSINSFCRIARLQLLKQHATQLDAFRGLYSASYLGLDTFKQQQEKIRNQLTNIHDKFKVKMKENTEESSKNVIFTEDLKNMIHIATEEDIEVVIKMMKKFNNQNKELRFGNFVFGPVAMRMFYTLNKPNEALECFKSPELQGLFDQIISYQILCDLLYENQRYDDVLECFKLIKDRQIEGTKYPRNVVVIVFAACYKMNTPESLNAAIKIWKELMDIGHAPARRATTYFSRLLVLNDKPDLSLEVLSNIQNQNYTTIRNLKVLTLTKLNRFEDAIQILKSILKQEQLQTFNKDVLEILREHLEKENHVELLNEFKHIMKIFQEQNHISNLTLDEQLSTEISGQVKRFDRNQNQFRPNNRPWQSRERFRPSQRLALRDLE